MHENDIPLSFNIHIENVEKTEFGYQCRFEISKSDQHTSLVGYKGYFYTKEYTLTDLLNIPSVHSFNYLNQEYKITGKFVKDWYSRNPGEVNPRIYLIAQKSFGEFRYDTIKFIPKQASRVKKFFCFLILKNANIHQRIRTKIDHQIVTCFQPREYALIKAMIIGDKRMITPELSDIYAKNGLSHILAISGLHIMLFIGFLEYMLRIFRIRKQRRFWIILIISFIYIWILGFIVSAIRAMCMGLGLVYTIAYDKIYAQERVLFLTVCLFLIFFPNALFSISFVLSFSAVFALFYLYPLIKIKYNKFRNNPILFFVCDTMNMSISILLVTFPVLVYFFKGISLSGCIVNIFVLPVVPLFYISSIIAVISSVFNLFLGHFLAGTATVISSYMLAAMHIFDNKYAFLNLGAFSGYSICLYYCGLITYVLYKNMESEKND